MATWLLDTFTDTDGVGLNTHVGETGATWTNGSNWQIFSNRARVATAGAVLGYASGSAAGNDYTVTIPFLAVSPGAGHTMEFLLDFDSGTTNGYLYRHNHGTGWQLFRTPGFSLLQTAGAATYSPGTSHTLTVTRTTSGANVVLSFYVDSVLVSTYTDTAPVSSGRKIGMRSGFVSSTTNGYHVDSITAVDGVTPPAPTAGTLSFGTRTNTQIPLTWTAPSGGTAPWAYTLHRGTTSGFTPGAGNQIYSGSGTSYTDNDAGLLANTIYYYKLVATDSAGTPNTVTYAQGASSLFLAPLKIGFIGDSITFAGTDITEMALQLTERGGGRTVTTSNQGISGTYTNDWVSGSTNLNNAKTAFAAAGITYVHIMLGTNDAKTASNSAATYKTNLQSCVNNLVSAGYTVILSYPPYYAVAGSGATNTVTEAQEALLQSYQAQIDSLVNGSTILQGDTKAFQWFANNPSALSDGVHPTNAGYLALGTLWADGIRRALRESGGGGLLNSGGMTGGMLG